MECSVVSLIIVIVTILNCFEEELNYFDMGYYYSDFVSIILKFVIFLTFIAYFICDQYQLIKVKITINIVIIIPFIFTSLIFVLNPIAFIMNPKIINYQNLIIANFISSIIII